MKHAASTDERFQGAPERRVSEAVDGVLLLDKPVGMTSNQALQAAKRLLGARKGGHTGSLDPIATGLLPLCFGQATKLSQFLLDADKRYWAVFKLGVTTRTYDREGEVTGRRPVEVGRAAVEAALAGFRGEIDQIPPMHSAIKQGGRSLYKLAHQGIEVPRDPRRVHIRELNLLRLEGDELELELTCSKGTYVRVLAHDLGERLGCGAHVADLRRLAVGALSVSDAVTLDSLGELTRAGRISRLMPMDQALSAIPGVRLSALAVHYLQQGQAVTARPAPTAGWVRLYDPQDRFLGMGEVLDDGRVAPRRLLSGPAGGA